MSYNPASGFYIFQEKSFQCTPFVFIQAHVCQINSSCNVTEEFVILGIWPLTCRLYTLYSGIFPYAHTHTHTHTHTASLARAKRHDSPLHPLPPRPPLPPLLQLAEFPPGHVCDQPHGPAPLLPRPPPGHLPRSPHEQHPANQRWEVASYPG